MAKITIDNSGERFGSKVSIADLAQFVPTIRDNHSNDLTIYQVESAMSDAYPFEIADWSYEYLTGYSATFKDGSIIHVGAWKDDFDALQDATGHKGGYRLY